MKKIKIIFMLIFLALLYYFFALFRPAIIIHNKTQVPIFLATMQSEFDKEPELEDFARWKGRYKILPNESKTFYLSFDKLWKDYVVEISNGIRVGQRHEGTTEFFQSVKTSEYGACQITFIVNPNTLSLKEKTGYFCHKKLVPVYRELY